MLVTVFTTNHQTVNYYTLKLAIIRTLILLQKNADLKPEYFCYNMDIYILKVTAFN